MYLFGFILRVIKKYCKIFNQIVPSVLGFGRCPCAFLAFLEHDSENGDTVGLLVLVTFHLLQFLNLPNGQYSVDSKCEPVEKEWANRDPVFGISNNGFSGDLQKAKQSRGAS